MRELVAALRARLQRKRNKAYLRWAAGDRCATCAYRQGTAASGDAVEPGLSRFRRALLDAAQPFMCHEDGPIPGKKRLCIGHMNAMCARDRAGYYRAHPPDAPSVVAELREAYRLRESMFAEEYSKGDAEAGKVAP
jgi:hypothetical protein